jgi:hypothetical protein
MIPNNKVEEERYIVKEELSHYLNTTSVLLIMRKSWKNLYLYQIQLYKWKEEDGQI